MAGLTAICAVSFADDVHSVPNVWRLLVQFASMLLMFVDLGFISVELWWAVVPALIVCVGIINAYNFMDGINGITGAYSLAVLIPLAVLNHRYGFVDPSLLYVTGLSVLVFCFFNFRKRARCFAGDVGSVGIAFIILFALGRLIAATGDIQYLLLLGVYGVDTVLTIMHRILLHEHLGSPQARLSADGQRAAYPAHCGVVPLLCPAAGRLRRPDCRSRGASVALHCRGAVPSGSGIPVVHEKILPPARRIPGCAGTEIATT